MRHIYHDLDFSRLKLADGTRADKLKQAELCRELQKISVPVNPCMGKQELLTSFMTAVNDRAKELASVDPVWKKSRIIPSPAFDRALGQITGAP